MILQALTAYYEQLVRQGKLSLPPAGMTALR